MYCWTQKRFKVVIVSIPVSWLYEATENELQGPGMTISKNATLTLTWVVENVHGFQTHIK